MKRHFRGLLLASTSFIAAGPGLAANAPAPPVIADGIAGVVASARGPEAGVWVIAETRDLPTRITRGMDGRVDDPSKGWKGKGIFATYASQPVWHQEGGEDGSGPQIVKFQIRPNPLAF